MNTNSTPHIRVGVAGDWHGNQIWAKKTLNDFHRADITRIYQVGDFGLWPGDRGKEYLRALHATATQHNQTIYVILGNHDDYDRVALMKPDEEGWLRLKDYPTLRFAPRGHTWLDGNIRMAALGGAGSIDKNLRTPGKTWWPQEEITDADCADLTANVTGRGWDRVDLLLTHEAPAGLIRIGHGGSRPHWFTEDVQHYCYTQRLRLRDAVDTVAPHALIHGHWHNPFHDQLDGTRPDGTPYETEVLGLAADGRFDNAAVITLQRGTGLTGLRHAAAF